MADLGLSLEELRYQPLELFAREGVKLLLKIAMEEEVAEFLGRVSLMSEVKIAAKAIAMDIENGGQGVLLVRSS